MKTNLRAGTALAVAAFLFCVAPDLVAQGSPLTLTGDGHSVHIFPSVARRASLASQTDTGPLLYHNNGPVMTSVNSYIIFWVPARLQNGGVTHMTPHYQTVQQNLLSDYFGHSLDNNNTQYYQVIAGKKTYISNSGAFAAAYVDTNPYPSSGCTDSVTSSNCITDAQLTAEIQRVMTLKGWTGGLGNIFFIYTSSGEGSCFGPGGPADNVCAYTGYCAYHGRFTNSASDVVVYANEPYGDPNFCQAPGTPAPSGDIYADTAATSASHELTEAITDPELNAWSTAHGSEIGDLCAYNYGGNTWDSSRANEMWNGHFYELQMEYDNHVLGCVQVGP